MVSKKLSLHTGDDLGWKEHALLTVVVNFSLVVMSCSPWLSHKNCVAHQELVAGRLSMNDMKTTYLTVCYFLLSLFVSHLKTTALL